MVGMYWPESGIIGVPTAAPPFILDAAVYTETSAEEVSGTGEPEALPSVCSPKNGVVGDAGGGGMY